jgi:hypothetical protein
MSLLKNKHPNLTVPYLLSTNSDHAIAVGRQSIFRLHDSTKVG